MNTLWLGDTPEKDNAAKNNEWYTPPRYVEAAREVMGGIDLDPASCTLANETVKATRYYTKEDNGLMQPWYGRVWCNPPYGHTEWRGGAGRMSHQRVFAEKLLREYQQGSVEHAVLLSLGNPNTQWIQPFFDYPVCFNLSTLYFQRPDGTEGHFGFPLAFVYLGPNEQTFINVFSRFGRVVRAIDASTPKPILLDLWQSNELAS